MQILLTYQIHEASSADERAAIRLKDILKAGGYQSFISGINSKGEKITSRLPGCTLFKERSNARDARAELRAAAKLCGVTIDCCIAAEIMEWSGISLKKGEAVKG